MDKNKITKKITDIEIAMSSADFWQDKNKAQEMITQLQDLKDQLQGIGKYDRGNAILTILAGAGGDDAEDFARILFEMYQKYFDNNNWTTKLLHANINDQGGYRNITIEVLGKNAYGNLQNENGVHRLVRLSPFNANSKRHTSFALVEVIPFIDKVTEIEIKPDDLKIDFSKSGGPGGQNVNKRDTAVRVTHLPSGITAFADNERTQEANRQKALQQLHGKIYNALEEARKQNQDTYKISAKTANEWGSQIRSYILHPYKLIKDHRNNFEVSDVDKVLERGQLDDIIKSLEV